MTRLGPPTADEEAIASTVQAAADAYLTAVAMFIQLNHGSAPAAVVRGFAHQALDDLINSEQARAMEEANDAP